MSFVNACVKPVGWFYNLVFRYLPWNILEYIVNRLKKLSRTRTQIKNFHKRTIIVTVTSALNKVESSISKTGTTKLTAQGLAQLNKNSGYISFLLFPTKILFSYI